MTEVRNPSPEILRIPDHLRPSFEPYTKRRLIICQGSPYKAHNPETYAASLALIYRFWEQTGDQIITGAVLSHHKDPRERRHNPIEQQALLHETPVRTATAFLHNLKRTDALRKPNPRAMFLADFDHISIYALALRLDRLRERIPPNKSRVALFSEPIPLYLESKVGPEGNNNRLLKTNPLFHIFCYELAEHKDGSNGSTPGLILKPINPVSV